MRCERGQATIEWVALVLLASLALGALAAAVPVMDGRSFGGFLSHRIVCSLRGSRCDRGDVALARAYGAGDAGLVRRYAPDIVYERGEHSLPVDWRECRRRSCSDAPDDPNLDAHTTDAGRRATAFTHVVHRHGRTYLQYWLYYPDSNSSVLASDTLWRALPGLRLFGYPGYHEDDWEGYQVRVDRRGRVVVRATAHGGYRWCKEAECDHWGPRTGWTRVSRGSHAGHIPLERRTTGWGVRGLAGGRIRVRYRVRLPGVDMHERTTTAAGLRLVPIELLARRRYRPRHAPTLPPWLKHVYRHPESDES